MANQNVLRWSAKAEAAGKKYDVPAWLLLGLIDIESKGDPEAGSRAGARGLTQFMPGTAPGYGVRFGSSDAATTSQIDGAARYLTEALGFKGNDQSTWHLALSKYNAGPNNPSAAGPYADNVLKAAKTYKTADALAAAGFPQSADQVKGGIKIDAADAVSDAASAAANATVDLIFKELGGSGGRILLYIGFVIGGAALVIVGVSRATGVKPLDLTPVGLGVKAVKAVA